MNHIRINEGKTVKRKLISEGKIMESYANYQRETYFEFKIGSQLFKCTGREIFN